MQLLSRSRRVVKNEKLPSWCHLLHRDVYFLQWHLFSFAFAGIWNSRQVWLTNRRGISGEQVVFGIFRLLFIKRLSLYLAFCTLIASMGSQIAPGLWMRRFSCCNEVYWQTQLFIAYILHVVESWYAAKSAAVFCPRIHGRSLGALLCLDSNELGFHLCFSNSNTS